MTKLKINEPQNMTVWRNIIHKSMYYKETRYTTKPDGSFEVEYKPFDTRANNLVFWGETEESIEKQVNAVLERIELPRPLGFANIVHPISITLDCPLCSHRMDYISNKLKTNDIYYMHKCTHCCYEYEMPYVYTGLVVWARDDRTVFDAMRSFNLEKLKMIVNTKPEIM